MAQLRNFQLLGLWLGVFWGATLPAASRPPYPPTNQKADWTVMIYMNGKGDLECDLLTDFGEIAKANSSAAVNVVVQLGRGGQQCSGVPSRWEGTLNFWVKQGLEPTPENACTKPECPTLEDDLDMGKAENVQRFLKWARKNFRARHYILVFASHGYGAVLRQLIFDQQLRAHDSPIAERRSRAALDPEPEGGYGFFSSDKSFLYIGELARVIHSVFPRRGLDVLAFDSCLMGSLESAYELRNVTKLIVGDESLEFTKGWDYRALVELLVQGGRDVTGLAVSRQIVEGYSQIDLNWLLSIVQTAHLKSVAVSLSHLADDLTRNCGQPHCWNALQVVRNNALEFGAEYSVLDKVDIESFARALMNDQNVSRRIRQRATLVSRALSSALYNPVSYRGRPRPTLSVYFPATKDDYCAQRIYDQGGYRLLSCGAAPWPQAPQPLHFVSSLDWSSFLGTYLSSTALSSFHTGLGGAAGNLPETAHAWQAGALLTSD